MERILETAKIDPSDLISRNEMVKGYETLRIEMSRKLN